MEPRNLEVELLEEAIEKKMPVRLIFTTGFQCEAIIEDYNYDVIHCRVAGKKWLVYRNGLSTIVLP